MGGAFTFRRWFESRCGRSIGPRFHSPLLSMCLNIWPPTLTSKPRCLVCVPLWPAAYAISISTRLYMWTNNNTSLFGFFLEVIHIYCILFTHLCTLSSLYGESFLPTVLPATTFRSLSPGLKCEESVVESLARNFSQRSGRCVMKQAWRKELESMRLINCA